MELAIWEFSVLNGSPDWEPLSGNLLLYMAMDMNSHGVQTDTNPDPSFHKLDILGKRIPCPHEGLRDNKMDSFAPIYSLNWSLYSMAYLQNGVCIYCSLCLGIFTIWCCGNSKLLLMQFSYLKKILLEYSLFLWLSRKVFLLISAVMYHKLHTWQKERKPKLQVTEVSQRLSLLHT